MKNLAHSGHFTGHANLGQKREILTDFSVRDSVCVLAKMQRAAPITPTGIGAKAH